jgi:hypothetical protein
MRSSGIASRFGGARFNSDSSSGCPSSALQTRSLSRTIGGGRQRQRESLRRNADEKQIQNTQMDCLRHLSIGYSYSLNSGPKIKKKDVKILNIGFLEFCCCLIFKVYCSTTSARYPATPERPNDMFCNTSLDHCTSQSQLYGRTHSTRATLRMAPTVTTVPKYSPL